jgi:hypothetical protein
VPLTAGASLGRGGGGGHLGQCEGVDFGESLVGAGALLATSASELGRLVTLVDASSTPITATTQITASSLRRQTRRDLAQRFSDRGIGLAGKVFSGTPRDSLHMIDVAYNHDGGQRPDGRP